MLNVRELSRLVWPHWQGRRGTTTTTTARGSGWTHRIAERLPVAPRRLGCDEWQAAALCRLVSDPQAGVTRVSVVSAPTGLRDAIAEAALDYGLTIKEAPAGPGPAVPCGSGALTLGRR